MQVRELLAGAVTLLLSIGCGQGGGGSSAAGVSPAPSAAVTVVGRVVADGAPVAGAFLVVGGPDHAEGPELDPATLVSGDDGAFALALPPGRWALTAVDPEGRSGSADLDVSGAQQALELSLQPLSEQLLLDLIEEGPALETETSEEAR